MTLAMLMIIKEWLQKFIAASVSVLAVIFFFKASNKKAADAKEDEIKREDAERLNEALVKNNEIEAKVHEEVNNTNNLDELGSKWVRK